MRATVIHSVNLPPEKKEDNNMVVGMDGQTAFGVKLSEAGYLFPPG
jgi:hypothetical protein